MNDLDFERLMRLAETKCSKDSDRKAVTKVFGELVAKECAKICKDLVDTNAHGSSQYDLHIWNQAANACQKAIKGKFLSAPPTTSKEEQLRKILGPTRREIKGKEYEKLCSVLHSIEPLRITNNQRSETSEYIYGGKIYHMTWFPNEPLFLEEILDD